MEEETKEDNLENFISTERAGRRWGNCSKIDKQVHGKIKLNFF